MGSDTSDVLTLEPRGRVSLRAAKYSSTVALAQLSRLQLLPPAVNGTLV